jgi:hypothetical protein
MDFIFFSTSGHLACFISAMSVFCALRYENKNCIDCKFKFFRSNFGFCLPCGWLQVLGSLVMCGLSVFFTVGLLVATLIKLKMKYDCRFKVVFTVLIKIRVVNIVKE